MEKALGYARIRMEKENIENQIVAIKEYAEREGFLLIDIVQDIDVSGSVPALEREGFRRLLQAAEALSIKVLIFYDLTRLGRDLFDVVSTYRYLLERGYSVLFIKHPELNVRKESPLGEAMRKALLVLLGVVAEFEHALIRERTKQGLERARREGKIIGRPPYPLPLEEVKRLRKMGWTLTKIHAYLVRTGKICRKVDGKEKCMSYERFRRRVKEIL